MKKKILIQVDPDEQASTFDAIVAIDSGVDHLLSRSNVTSEGIESLVHGAMFTRGPKDLSHTALFFGGSNVARTEALVQAAKKCFFGPIRVSLMSDPNGSNTTAAAAVLAVQRHLDLNRKTVAIFAGTGPVGIRIAQIISRTAGCQEVTLRIGSRRLEKATAVCEQLQAELNNLNEARTNVHFHPIEISSLDHAFAATADCDVLFAAGAAGIQLMDSRWEQVSNLKVIVDINAVPPAGIEGVEVTDSGTDRQGVICYGAIGVGSLKMKIHKRAIKQLFESNDQLLDTEAIYRLGANLEMSTPG